MSNVLEFKTTPTVTVCRTCAHVRHIIKNSAAPNVWYNWFCEANHLNEEIDPVTGERGFMSVNDLGGRYFTKIGYHFCRDINTGNCPGYESAK